jgi:hypothetical protein
MTAIVLPDIDFDELRKNIPSLAELDLPSLGKAGAKADDAIDHWRGRSTGPSWPWIAAGVFLVGPLVALVSWSRRGETLVGTDLPAQPFGGESYVTETVTTDSWPSTESTPA